jgi:hypothetical protein
VVGGAVDHVHVGMDSRNRVTVASAPG